MYGAHLLKNKGQVGKQVFVLPHIVYCFWRWSAALPKPFCSVATLQRFGGLVYFFFQLLQMMCVGVTWQTMLVFRVSGGVFALRVWGD
jgi:hypothetical protein